MAGKRGTKKRSSSKKSNHVFTIPELRKAFEHIETFVELHCKKSVPVLSKLFKEEWKKTFKKDITMKEAEAYVENELKIIHQKKPSERKHSGGAMALTGAPILADTRPGLYISPGVNEGSYAQVPAYVDKGFWNPEIARQYDPVPGQTHYPAYTPYGMGSNKALIGGRRTRRNNKKQTAGGLLSAASQFFGMRPIFGDMPPPSFADNARNAAMASAPLPQSPSPAETRLAYASNLTGQGIPVNPSSVTVLPTTANIPAAWYSK
jgi:hypothetical protein